MRGVPAERDGVRKPVRDRLLGAVAVAGTPLPSGTTCVASAMMNPPGVARWR
jgi:hypothetical protein